MVKCPGARGLASPSASGIAQYKKSGWHHAETGGRPRTTKSPNTLFIFAIPGNPEIKKTAPEIGLVPRRGAQNIPIALYFLVYFYSVFKSTTNNARNRNPLRGFEYSFSCENRMLDMSTSLNCGSKSSENPVEAVPVRAAASFKTRTPG